MAASPEPLPDLIEESHEEAVFLWSRWEADLASYSRNLREVYIWSEDRLGGALDGVQLAPRAMLERTVAAAQDSKVPATHRVLAHVLAVADDPSARDLLADVLRTAGGARLRDLARGIEVAPLNGSFAPVAKLLAAVSPEHAATLGRIKAFRRAGLGPELTVAYESAVAEVQIDVLRAVARLPPEYVPAWVDAGLKHAEPAARVAVIESGLHHRSPQAWAAALNLLREPAPHAAGLLRFLAMLGSEADHRILFKPHADPVVQREALWALGHVGTPEAVEHCLEAMKMPAYARLAGEVYCLITGADLVRDHLTAADPAADAETPAFEDDDLDANLVPTAEQGWPLPDPAAVTNHWTTHSPRFTPGLRHLRGRPADAAGLIEAVESGPMLRRPDHAFELYVRSEGKYDVEPRATYTVQRSMMSRGRISWSAG